MNITIKLKNWGQNTDFTKINIDTHSLKMHSAITQSSKINKTPIVSQNKQDTHSFPIVKNKKPTSFNSLSINIDKQ